jgi:hypothetical protein
MFERAVMSWVWLGVLFLLLLPESVTSEVPFYGWAQRAAALFVAWQVIRYLRWRFLR